MPAAKTEGNTTFSGEFKENIKRDHFQACILKAALDEKPPNLILLKLGL